MLQNIKNKKTLFFGFLLLTVLYIFFFTNLNLAYAQEVPLIDSETLRSIVEEAQKGEQCKSNLVWYESIVAGIADILLYIPKAGAQFATWLTQYVIERVVNWPITTGTDGAAKAFQDGWRSVRDLANMMIVLGFVIIGIATTLRIRDYEAKKMLLPLILVALLINFSGLLCGIVIDASNITMKTLLSGGTSTVGATNSVMGSDMFTYVKNVEKNAACTALRDGKLGVYMVTSFEFAFVYFILAFCFFYLSIVLIARYGVLGILFILSPLAFVFRAFPFPKAKELWGTWINNFIKWSFIGVGLGFFMNIASQMLDSFSNLLKDPAVTSATVFFYLFIVIVIFLVGIKISTKGAAIGATAVLGLATGGLGMALGATGIKGLASRAGASIKDRATTAGEKIGLVSKGTTAQSKQSRLGDSRKRLENIQNNEELAKIAAQPAGTHQRALDKAAAAEILMKRNAFDNVPAAQREAVAKHAASFGVSKETISKTDASLLSGTPDKEAKKQLMNDERIRLEGIYGVGDSRIEPAVKEYGKGISSTALENKKREMAKEKTQQTKLGYVPVTDAEVRVEAESRYTTPSAAQLDTVKQEMNTRRAKEKTLGFSYATKDDARNNLITEEAKRLRAAGTTGASLDTALQSYGSSITPAQIDTELTRFNQERLQKAVGKMAPAKASELPEDIMTTDVVSEFNANQMTNVLRNAPRSLINKFRSSAAAHVRALRAAGNTTEAARYIAMLREASSRATR